MDRQKIKEIFLEHGFTIKEGHDDLKEYVYEAAEALLREAASGAVPESLELEPYSAGELNDYGGGNVDWWWDYIRAELSRAQEFYQSQVDAGRTH